MLLQLSKTITELQSEIVKSPEEYKKRLKEVEKQQSSKDKQREIMQETFQDKKHLVEQQKVILTFIQKQLDKFGEVRDMNEQLKYLYNYIFHIHIITTLENITPSYFICMYIFLEVYMHKETMLKSKLKCSEQILEKLKQD